MYGGHFFVAGGRLDFIACLFYDMEILTPMTDRLRFGDDIFVRWVRSAFILVVCCVVCCFVGGTGVRLLAGMDGCH